MLLVIISDPSDPHIPFVTRHLLKPPIILGSENILHKEELSYRADTDTEGFIQCVYKGQVIKNVTSVWLRRPHFALSDPLPVPARYEEYCYSAIKEHVGALYVQFADALWVSDYFSIRRASYKPLQHTVAAALGFHLPDTLFTTSAEAARQFIAARPATVVKTQADSFPLPKGKNKGTIMFSRKIMRDEQLDLSGLYLAPTIFQEAVDTDFDIRVTIVGEKVFSAAVRRHGTRGKYAKMLDWRTGSYSGSLDIQKYNLPKDIAEKCVAHVKRLGLKFGAIDLVMDKKGQIWFLENNPNGQWAFVEEATGQPIGKALAELLTEG